VVIVNWNSGPALAACLDSLQRFAPASEWEAVVVDNASGDGSDAAAGRPGVRLVRNRHNRGLAAANNQGISTTSGEFLIIANPDVVFGPRSIDELVASLRRHPGAAFAVPRLVFPDGAPQTSAGDLPSLGDALVGRSWSLARRRWAAGRGGRHRRAEPSGPWWHGWSHDEDRPIGRGAEACYAVRRSALASIGLQDERYRLDWEGVDWAERAARAGWEVRLAPDAVVTHVGGVSVAGAPLRWVVQSHLGMYRYFADRSAPGARPFLAAVIAARALAKLAAVAAGAPVYRWAQGRR